MNEQQAHDLSLLVRALNDIAGVAGGLATPYAAHALTTQLARPEAEEPLIRWASTVSGLAWAGASLLDLLLLIDERNAARR